MSPEFEHELNHYTRLCERLRLACRSERLARPGYNAAGVSLSHLWCAWRLRSCSPAVFYFLTDDHYGGGAYVERLRREGYNVARVIKE